MRGGEGTGRIIAYEITKNHTQRPSWTHRLEHRTSLLKTGFWAPIIYDINFIFFTSQIQSVFGRAGVSGTLDLVMVFIAAKWPFSLTTFYLIFLRFDLIF